MAGYISEGDTVKNTCILCNIHESTFYLWVNKMRKVEQKIENGQRINDNEEVFIEFIESVKKAIALFQSHHVRKIHNEKHWTASAWLLERRFPETWGRKDKLEITHKAEFDLSKASIEEKERVFKELDIMYDGKAVEIGAKFLEDNAK